MDAREKQKRSQKRFYVLLALCVFLPPVGLLLVWRGRYKQRAKLCFTLLSTLVMMGMCSLYIRLLPPEEIAPALISASTLDAEETDVYSASPTQAPSEDSTLVAPANPNG